MSGEERKASEALGRCRHVLSRVFHARAIHRTVHRGAARELGLLETTEPGQESVSASVYRISTVVTRAAAAEDAKEGEEDEEEKEEEERAEACCGAAAAA